MRWLESGGPQFSFGDLTPGEPAPAHTHFYTSNVSLKRELFLEVGGFDERFRYAAVEDIEFGVRLAEAGIELVYDPTLVVLHDHPTTLAQSLERMVRVGRSASLYNAIHPERPLPRELPVPTRSMRTTLIRPLARLLAAGPVPDVIRHRAWLALHVAAYERGYRLGHAAAGTPDGRGAAMASRDGG